MITAGGTAFKWQASPFGDWNASYSDWQIFQPGNVSMKVMEIHNPAGVWSGNDTGVGYAGSIAMTLDDTIIIGFYGEGWKGCEANQFLHFHAETGVFLGQFGTPNCFQRKDDAQQYAVPGAAGNAFSPTLVKGATSDDGTCLQHCILEFPGVVWGFDDQLMKMLRIPLASGREVSQVFTSNLHVACDLGHFDSGLCGRSGHGGMHRCKYSKQSAGSPLCFSFAFLCDTMLVVTGNLAGLDSVTELAVTTELV